MLVNKTTFERKWLFSRVTSCGLKWGNKTNKLNSSIQLPLSSSLPRYCCPAASSPHLLLVEVEKDLEFIQATSRE